MSATPPGRQLAAIASSVLAKSLPGTASTWPRLSAILGRQSIETSLDRLWAVVGHPELDRASMRAQLLCVDEFLGPDLGRQVDYAWNRLSAACHHHAYLLEPAAAELEDLVATARDLDAAISSLAARSGSPTN